MALRRAARNFLAVWLVTLVLAGCGGSGDPLPGLEPRCGPDAVCADIAECVGDACLPAEDGVTGSDVAAPGLDASAPKDVASRDTGAPGADVGRDAGPDVPVCRPSCTGRECGADGCGGLCGTCGTGETCDAGTCIPGVCGEGRPAIDGALATEVSAVTFDKVTAAIVHKQDIDEYEDGCFVLVALDFQRGFGCALHVEAGRAVSRDGGLRVTALTFSADSQCPGFPDDSEGQYTLGGDMILAEIVPGILEVPDRNAPESCFATTLELRLEGELAEVGGARTLRIAPTTLRVTGELRSIGDTGVRCPCRAACDGRECGDDGCGGSCGGCPGGYCDEEDGTCVCVRDCRDRECGDDGCGGSCGGCAEGFGCRDGQCVCQPDCDGRVCGSDGCGGSCGTCPVGRSCTAAGRCAACTPDCEGRVCGDDGCGGSCGSCGFGETCAAGRCGCGDITYFGCCEEGAAVFCDQSGAIVVYPCDNGCGWQNAQVGYNCGGRGADPNGQYPLDCGLADCVPSCTGRECGTDGCLGSCGECSANEACDDGRCVACQPRCTGKECGPDGCDGTCGTCADGETCNTAGACVSEPAVEDYGVLCETDADCVAPLQCLDGLGAGALMCTRACSFFGNDCPTGMVCFPNLINPPPAAVCIFSTK